MCSVVFYPRFEYGADPFVALRWVPSPWNNSVVKPVSPASLFSSDFSSTYKADGLFHDCKLPRSNIIASVPIMRHGM